MFDVSNSALKERRVVKLPGPANNGKANGNTEANFGLLSSSSLNKVIPKIISKARKNKISEPATANSLTLIPIKLNICSPTNRNAIIRTAAITEAVSDCICPAFSRKEIIIGKLPTISITANKIIVAVKISLKSKSMISVF